MDNELKTVIKDAAGRLTGFDRCAYQTKITSDYFGGSARSGRIMNMNARAGHLKERRKI